MNERHYKNNSTNFHFVFVERKFTEPKTFWNNLNIFLLVTDFIY